MLGQHAMMPDLTLSQHFRSSEEPAPFPSGPNTSFLDPTPMPARFQESSLESHNLRHTNTKPEDPTYSTSSSEVGKLPLQGADFPIRWYGLRGEFTSAFFLGGKGPASKVSTGLKQPLATLTLEACILILAHATALALSLTSSALALILALALTLTLTLTLTFHSHPPSPNQVNTGLNASMDRSDFHSTFDQGWSGHLGLRDHNIPSLHAASFVGRPPRRQSAYR